MERAQPPAQSGTKSDVASKVPKVTAAFWAVKILATTFGETGGDALSMTLRLGYAESTLIFLAFFACALFAQVKSRHYHPVFYWALVVSVLALWRHSTGAIRVDRITAGKDEIFYWVTILVSNTLGTALGDFVA